MIRSRCWTMWSQNNSCWYTPMKLKIEMAVVTSPPMKAAVLRVDQGWRGRSRFARWTPQR